MLCDLISVYFEGAKCPLAKRGYSRDGRRGKLQIVFVASPTRLQTRAFRLLGVRP